MIGPGTVLDGRYELLELLGEGGMGQVFKARHNRLGKIFAVKSLRHLSPDPVEQAKFLKAFESEARTLAELDHPALARVSDFFEVENIHFLVMEFIDGRTLSRVVELAPKNLSQRRVLQWAEELCDVLTYLHRQEPPVIVRDLKPENILIDSKRQLRLIDFGISKRLQPGVATQDIVKGMGTAEYAPLEQYGASTTDQRSDIYAFGATLYFLLTEIAPPPAWKRASEGAEPVPPSQVNPTVSPEFEQLLARMMALKKEGRPQSIEEVRKVLQSIPARSDSPQRRTVRPGASQAANAAPKEPPWSKAPPPPTYADDGSSPEKRRQGHVRSSTGNRYGIPGGSLDSSRTVIRPSMAPSGTGRIPRLEVKACRSLRRYATTPECVKFCPGKPLVTVGGRYLQLWGMDNEQIRSKLWSGEQQIVSLDYSSDGRFLAAGESEGEIHLYDIGTEKRTARLGRRSWGLFPDRVRAVCFVFGQSKVAVASDSSNIRIFYARTGEQQEVLEWHQTGLFSKLGRKTVSLACSRLGVLAAGGADGTLTLYETQKFERKEQKSFRYGELQALEFSADGQFLAIAGSKGTVALLKTETLETVYELKQPSSPLSMAFSHDLRLLATGGSDCKIRLYHFNSGKELMKLSHHTGAVLDLDFSDLGPALVSVGNDLRFYVTELAW